MKRKSSLQKSGPWYFYLIMGGIQWLPLSMALWLGSFMGFLTYCLWRQRTAIALSNLQRVWVGEKSGIELRQIVRNMYRNLGQGLVEFLRLPLLTLENVRDRVSIEGMKHLEAARDQGRGVFLLSAHFGNWEMLSAVVALSGIPTNVLVKKIRNPSVDGFINGIRRGSGVNPINKQNGAEDMLERLRNNEAVGFVLDQHADATEGVTVRFFGQEASTHKSLALLARRYRVPIVPVFMIRERLGFHRVVFEPVLELCKGKNVTDSILDDTQQCMNVLERFIRHYPDQWIWLHRRWK
jgi:KDO2-lipid IV(A) lauroyltransferase